MLELPRDSDTGGKADGVQNDSLSSAVGGSVCEVSGNHLVFLLGDSGAKIKK